MAPESRVRVSGSSVMTSGFLVGEGPPLNPPAPSPGLFSLWHERGLWVPGPELPAGSSLLGVCPRPRRLLKHNLKGRSAAFKGQMQPRRARVKAGEPGISVRGPRREPVFLARFLCLLCLSV